MAQQDEDFNPDEMYERFPRGEDLGYGPEQGYNVLVRLNDPSLFTEEAQRDPVIRSFLDAPFEFRYAMFKSSTRESEWYVHKPHRVFAGEIDGIHGSIENFNADDPRIGTYVINHHRTLAVRPIRTFVVSDDTETGQMIYKGDGS